MRYVLFAVALLLGLPGVAFAAPSRAHLASGPTPAGHTLHTSVGYIGGRWQFRTCDTNTGICAYVTTFQVGGHITSCGMHPGKKYYLFRIWAGELGTGYTAHQSDFRLITANGKTFPALPGCARPAAPLLPTTTLAAGATVEGWVEFRIPLDWAYRPVTVQWDEGGAIAFSQVGEAVTESQLTPWNGNKHS